MKTITLVEPLKKGEVMIEELIFKDMKAGHLLAVDGLDLNSTAATMALASALTGVPELMFKLMGSEDWVEVRTEVRMACNRFFGASKMAIAASLAVELQPSDFGQLVRSYAKAHELNLGSWLGTLTGENEGTP